VFYGVRNSHQQCILMSGMSRSTRVDIAVAAAFVSVAVIMTWPLSFSSTLVPDSDDAYFSVWRLSWIAHQLPRDPFHLFDANIFYPDRNTLAYSDAMLLVGAASSPLIWAGLEPVRVHNVLLVVTLGLSLFAMYRLAMRLTGQRLASIFAALAFALCPYRFAHIGHLELQWVFWMPFALLALHGYLDRPSCRQGLLTGSLLCAQAFCSIYYGVFLAIYLTVAAVVISIANGKVASNAIRYAITIALPLILFAAVYGRPYIESRRTMGPRPMVEAEEFSASLADYARVSPQNRVQLAIGLPIGDDEHSLFPGFVLLALAVVAVRRRMPRMAWAYVVLTLIAFDASLGQHGFTFRMLRQLIPILTSLRASARFGILVQMSLAILAAYGCSSVSSKYRWGRNVVRVACMLVLIESFAAPITVRRAELSPDEGDLFLLTMPLDAVVAEFPMPRPDSLWLYETTHQLRSINHWRRLVNGYSGFVPREYERTLVEVEGFPDARSFRRLREIGVDVVIVNRVFYDKAKYDEIEQELMSSANYQDLRRLGRDGEEALIVRVPK
jgi:hypothetical protein